jgi:diguanylate cyclase (GGDEF)-like protein
MALMWKDGYLIHLKAELKKNYNQFKSGTIRNITKRKEIKNKTEYIDNHDKLTKLANRGYFKKRITLQCKEAKEKENSFALMILDIDGFKYINDALGYHLGDKLIIEIAQRLRTFVGNTKFICRYSGDRFAFLVPGLSTREEYEDVSKDIVSLFSSPFKIDNYELNVTMSMGVSIYPKDGHEPDSLKSHARSALLRAKAEGKNRYQFYSFDMNIQNYKQFVLRNDLRKAIEEDQFKIYYQPQVNLKTSKILAAEALIRWEHPTWGLVSPIEFISLAEETGFIIDIGKWMLRKVCQTYKKWISDGLAAIKISVNYSGIQFGEKNFVANIKDIINEFQLDPHFLIIEITESVLMKNTEQVISNIQNLQAFGIQMAIDDFGTGYSSLQYLNLFNIDILKIDSSFIKNVLSDKTSDIITRSVINLAQELRIKLVAEGIETREQLSYLRELNCHTGQGFLYSKPVPLQEFEKILDKKKHTPIQFNDPAIIQRKESRRFFRIKFTNLLEGDMTILEIDDKKVNLGDTKVLINNIGPGGVCFTSNIRLPVKMSIILQFKTELLGEEINAYGCPVWIQEVQGDLYEYGIKFTFDENERTVLIKVLNQFQVKKKNNFGFTDSRFISDSPIQYFTGS